MVENFLNIHGDEFLYVGDHIYTDVSQSKVHLRWRTALICRELEDEVSRTVYILLIDAERSGSKFLFVHGAIQYGALIRGRDHRAKLVELIHHKETVGDLFNQLRLAFQRRTKGRPAQVNASFIFCIKIRPV